MSQRITIDPVTRIEGHLRIDCEIIERRRIQSMGVRHHVWRGMEEIVKNRDPRGCVDDCAAYLVALGTTTHAISPFVRRKAREY